MIIKESDTKCNLSLDVKSATEKFLSDDLLGMVLENEKSQPELPKQERTCPEVKCNTQVEIKTSSVAYFIHNFVFYMGMCKFLDDPD